MSEPMSYIARATCCGNLVAAEVDNERTDRKALARHIASWVRDGLVVERMTVVDVRQAKWGCHCKDKPGKQAVLTGVS